MREILFRGKRLDNGEWVEGGSIFRLINKIGEHFFIPRFGEGLIATHDDNMMNIVALEDMVMYRVDPETIGQYAAMKDKNGAKIFEGDIAKITDKYGNSVVYVVEFYRGAFSLKQKGVDYWAQFIDFHLKHYEFEVIGNIHDNKELLKEGGEE